MNNDQIREELVRNWLAKTGEALSSAATMLETDHLVAAMNRLYYACFYAVTALLLKDGKQFARHSTVRGEFNRSYVKPGLVDQKWGDFYRDLFTDRQKGDYTPLAAFEASDVKARLAKARQFIQRIRDLIGGRPA